MVDLIIWEGLLAALGYSLFCRSTHTTKRNTRRDIRWSFAFLGAITIVAAVAPLFGYDPDALTILLVAGMTIVQLVTAFHWRRGVPGAFRAEP